MVMTIEQSIALQRRIADPKISVEDAIRLLVREIGIPEKQARQRVLLTRGTVSIDATPKNVASTCDAQVPARGDCIVSVASSGWHVVSTKLSVTSLSRRTFVILNENFATAA